MFKRAVMPFFFSSRRRHTRLTCDWSSDVCSSDLAEVDDRLPSPTLSPATPWPPPRTEIGSSASRAKPTAATRSEERRVGKGVDLGGRRIDKKKIIDHDQTLREIWVGHPLTGMILV